MSEQPPEYGTPPSSPEEPTPAEPEPTPAEPVPTPDEAAAQASLWEDFLDIFYAPTSVFQRREGKPWWPALLVLVVIATILFIAYQQVLSPVMQLEMQRSMAEAMEANPDLTAADMERMGSIGQVFSIVGFVVVYPIAIILVGLLLWVFGKLFGAVASVGSLIMVATYSQIVRLLQSILGILQGVFMDVTAMDSMHDVSFSLARFMDPETSSAAVVMAAARVEVFTIWATVLLAIGLNVIGKVPKASAYIAAFLVWVIAALPQVLPALLRGG